MGKRCCISLARDLNNDTQNHDASAHHHRSPPSQVVPKAQDEYRTKEAAYLVYRGHEPLHCRVALGGCEEIVEGRSGDYAGHDALVIAEEDETCCCNCGDSEG